MKFKYFTAVCAAILYHAVPATHGQTEWVWGKSSNGNGNTGAGNSNYNNFGSGNNNNNNNNGLSNGGSGAGSGNGGGISFLGQRPNNYQGASGSGNGNNAGGGSNLVPVHTVTIIGNNGGSGLVSGPGGSASASGDKYFTSQSQSVPGNSGQPIIVQVLQPGTSGSGSIGSDSNSKSNDILPSNSIRAVGGEARLFPHIHKFIRRLVHGSNSNTHSSNGGGGSGISNLISSGGFGGGNPGIFGSLLQIGPQLAQGISNRFPTGPSSSQNNEFNTQGSSSSGSTGSSFLGSGDCNCVPSDQCRLPRIGKGTCSGGIMCCRSSGTRLIGESDYHNTKSHSTRYQPADIRRGLFGEIVRGTSNILDDTLDFFLAPFLTQEDQQKLANRIADNTRKG